MKLFLSLEKALISSGTDYFSSWKAEEDCCKWSGVGCGNVIGHVTKLELHSRDPFNILPGEIGSSLLNLPYLRHLDLSQNKFGYSIPILEFIGSLHHIEYLNLSNANFHMEPFLVILETSHT